MNFKKASAIALKASLGASMLASAFAPTAMAAEPTIEISKERYEQIGACREKTSDALRAFDQRNEPGFEEYYLRDQAVHDAVAIAAATGKFKREQELASLLDRHITGLAFMLVDQITYRCALFTDGNGNLPPEMIEDLAPAIRDIAASSDQMMRIIKDVQKEGDKLAAQGAKPPTDPNISIFAPR